MENIQDNIIVGQWKIPKNVDTTNFNFSWRPDPFDPPYIHQFGTQWQRSGGPQYIVQGATAIKYQDCQHAIKLPEPEKFKVLVTSDIEFDFSWHPDELEPPFIWTFGNQFHQPEFMPTIEYVVEGATQRKFIYDLRAKLTGNKKYWYIKDCIDLSKFDLKWQPNPLEPPFIYVWGNKWVDGTIMGTCEYHVPGAEQKKFMGNDVEVLPQWDRWKILHEIDRNKFDFTWRPNPFEPPFIYVWGNQWNDAVKEPTLEYHVPGATDKKYMTECVDVVHNTTNFKQLIPNIKFDYSWRPDPYSPPYIYVWGNQWNEAVIEPTLEYHVPGATDYKYMTDMVATVLPSIDNWKILIEGATFDFSWRPNPKEPPFIYVWGNKWNEATVEPTVEYHVPGATDKKYMDNMIAALPQSNENWTINNENCTDFDFSWRPNPHSPPQIYQWENNGPTFKVPGATEVVLMKLDKKYKSPSISKYFIRTNLDDLIAEHPNEVFWALNGDLNYDKFDFNWTPGEENFRHVNVFGNEFSKDLQTYYVNGPLYQLGFKDFNYVEEQTIQIESKLSMFYIDTGLSDCSTRFDELKTRYPQIQKTRFLNSWVETITRCIKKTETKLFWVLSSDLDYTDFDFNFYPSKWQMGMLHVFGNQYSHWGNTYLVNSDKFAESTKHVKIIEHVSNINHVRAIKAKTLVCKHDILYINHNNVDTTNNIEIFKNLGRTIFNTNYENSYLNTIKKFINKNKELLKKENYYLWVTSSICDYTNFDFSWQYDPFQFDQVHVFASELNNSRQKFGDTFLINLSEFAKNCAKIKDLENYPNKVNYIEHITSTRIQHPIIEHNCDSQVDAIKLINAEYFPYYELIHNDAIGSKTNLINLWEKNKETIIVGSVGASQIFLPHVAIKKVKDEIYDYSFVDKAKKLTNTKPLNIVFISNGEPIADKNYEVLIKILKDKKATNKVFRVKNVNGRVASQHAAANLSETSWYFLINGKVRVNETFDWNWQPDRLQQPKHYIFNVTNPVNDLVYGHQAIVANNKNLTLQTKMKGLDFTLDTLHEVVDINCGTAIYNTDVWTTWRTAFRESIKLRNNNDETSKERLQKWTSEGKGEFAEVSQRGALDGIEYWENVNGDMSKLILTYDWEWIHKYYSKKYGN